MFVKNLLKPFSFQQLKPIHWLLLLSAFFILHIPAILNDHHNTNAYVLFAHSLLRGHLTLPQTGDYGDMIFFQGKYYLPYPPFPALVIIPFMLIMGPAAVNSVLICVLLSCLNIYLLYGILKRLEITGSIIPWLIYGFFFGTSYWYVLFSSHHVYGFAQVVAVTCILLLLYELFGKKRILLLSIYLGLACLSRQMTIFFALFVLGYLYYQFKSSDNTDLKRFLRESTLFLLFLVPFLVVHLLYNYARFGNPLDTGYSHILFIGVLKERVNEYGVFSMHYVLYNIYSLLIKGFNIQFTGKDLLRIKDMDLFGTSLLSASPFLIAALKTGWGKIPRMTAWGAIIIITGGLLFYHNNGFEQVNAYRFTLDFLPLLLVLAAFGARHLPGWLFKGMIIYSIALNILAQGIHVFYHTFHK